MKNNLFNSNLFKNNLLNKGERYYNSNLSSNLSSIINYIEMGKAHSLLLNSNIINNNIINNNIINKKNSNIFNWLNSNIFNWLNSNIFNWLNSNIFNWLNSNIFNWLNYSLLIKAFLFCLSTYTIFLIINNNNNNIGPNYRDRFEENSIDRFDRIYKNTKINEKKKNNFLHFVKIFYDFISYLIKKYGMRFLFLFLLLFDFLILLSIFIYKDDINNIYTVASDLEKFKINYKADKFESLDLIKNIIKEIEEIQENLRQLAAKIAYKKQVK